MIIHLKNYKNNNLHIPKLINLDKYIFYLVKYLLIQSNRK